MTALGFNASAVFSQLLADSFPNILQLMLINTGGGVLGKLLTNRQRAEAAGEGILFKNT